MFEVGNDSRAGDETFEAGVWAGGFAHVRVVGHHIDLRKVVALAGFEVVGIVRGSDFHRAGAEFAIDGCIRDDGDFSVRERQQNFFADEVLIALVVGVHCDGGIAQHRLGARGRDDNVLFRSSDRVADVPQAAGAFVVDDFEIADGGEAARAPIDQITAAIDQAVAIEAEESFKSGAVERGLESEALAGPVAGNAEADHLVFYYAAAFDFPFPDAALEFFAAQILALDSFLGEHAFDDELGGYSGVVHAGEPEGAFAAHAMPADEHVNLRVLEHVADVNRAGDVWRGKRDRKRAAAAVAGVFGAK